MKQLRSSMCESESVFINGCNCTYPAGLDNHVVSDSSSLSQLLSGFFVFYSKLEFSGTVLDLSTGAILSLSDFQVLDDQAMADRKPALVSNENGGKQPRFKLGSMNIRDPFELHHNVAGNVNEKQLKIFTKCVRNAALACKMQRYFSKPKTKHWGILNLFIDHHSKEAHVNAGHSHQNEAAFRLEFPPPAEAGSAWTHTSASCLLTVLRDVFLVSFSNDCFPFFASTSSFRRESTSSNLDDSASSDRSNDADVSSSSEQEVSVGRKRKASDPCTYCKRAKVMITSSECLPPSPVHLPFTATCRVTHKLWEGRRRARRRLVQKGKSDFLDLEREVSRLILSDRSDTTSGTLLSSTCLNSSWSSCDSNEQSIFQFDLSLTRDDRNYLCALFQPKLASTEFSNFFRHLQVFLPGFILKCANK